MKLLQDALINNLDSLLLANLLLFHVISLVLVCLKSQYIILLFIDNRIVLKANYRLLTYFTLHKLLDIIE